MHTRFTLILFLSIIAIQACNNDDDELNQVPIVATDMTININLPGFSALQNPGGWVYLNGGSRGIIVYRASLESFSAFDRHCTYRVQDGCQVVVDDGITATDSLCCGAQFEIVNGLPITEPAERPLTTYRTQYNPNVNLLRVFN